MAVDPTIQQKADDIRMKIYGEQVRESLASGLEAMSEDVVGVEGRQDEVETQFQQVIENTTDKDVVSAPEIIAARNGEENLKARLDKENQEVTSQLEQTNSDFEAVDKRIDNLVIPISEENTNVEVTDAHNSIVKNKNFDSLKERFEENEDDFLKHKTAYEQQNLHPEMTILELPSGIRNEFYFANNQFIHRVAGPYTLNPDAEWGVSSTQPSSDGWKVFSENPVVEEGFHLGDSYLGTDRFGGPRLVSSDGVYTAADDWGHEYVTTGRIGAETNSSLTFHINIPKEFIGEQSPTPEEISDYLRDNPVEFIHLKLEPQTIQLPEKATANAKEIMRLSKIVTKGYNIKKSLQLEHGDVSIETGMFRIPDKDRDITNSHRTGKFLSVTSQTPIIVNYNDGVLFIHEYGEDFRYLESTQVDSGVEYRLKSNTRYVKLNIRETKDPYPVTVDFFGKEKEMLWVKNPPSVIHEYNVIDYSLEYEGETLSNSLGLWLPPNYDVYGDPVRLVYFRAGMGSYAYDSWNPVGNYQEIVNYLCDEGYAVFTSFNWTSKYKDLFGGNNFGSPIAFAALSSSYEWIIDHFNIRTDGMFATGKSSGGRIMGNLAMGGKGVPMLAVAGMAPVFSLTGDTWDSQTRYMLGYSMAERLAHAEDYGFSGDASVLPEGQTFTLPLNSNQLDYLRENLPKTVGYNAMWNGLINGDIDRFIESDIKIADADYDYYASLSRVSPVPIKLWYSYDDLGCDPQFNDAFVQSIKNANGLAEKRIMPDNTGGHYSVDFHPDSLKVDITTKLGVLYEDFPLAYTEAVQWFRRFG